MDQEKLEQDVNKIMTNHLPHITERLARVETKIDLIGKGIWAVLAATLANIVGTFFK